jgi:hypothetical protein
MTPSHELTAEQLAEEVNRWANEELIGRTPLPFEWVITQVEEMLTAMAREEMKLVNPRMEGSTLVADGFFVVRPVTQVHISSELKIPEKEYEVGDPYP